MNPVRLSLFLLLASSAALGQNTPPPPSPFPPPITAYEGRYLDSGQTPDFQFPDRTLRSYKAKAAPELNLMLMSFSGSAFAAYDLGTLPQRLASSPVRSTGAHGEKYLPPDVFFDAQAPGSGFQIILQDGQIFLKDFDYDDRGDFYLAFSAWGFAMLDRNGQLLSQVVSPPVVPLAVLSVRVGGTYYALVSDTSTTVVYDVTNAASPVFVRTLPFAIVASAKTSANIAVVTGTGTLRIYIPSALVAGTAPLQELAPPGGGAFVDATTDGVTYYTLSFNSSLVFSVGTVAPQGGGYVLSTTPLGGFGTSIRYGAGYLGVPTLPRGLVLFAVGSSGLTRTDLSSYTTSAYSGAFVIPGSAVPFSSGASTNLLLAYAGIGDVFQLAAVTPIPAVSPLALGVVALALMAIAALKLR
jgi:hypothetical protein